MASRWAGRKARCCLRGCRLVCHVFQGNRRLREIRPVESTRSDNDGNRQTSRTTRLKIPSAQVLIVSSRKKNNSPYVTNVKEIVGFDRHIQETVVMISQPGIREHLISSRHHMGNQAGRRQSSSAWLEQPTWLDQTELQYRVQFIHILLLLPYIEKQMEFFFSPVKSCHMSTWKSPEEMFAIGWQKLEGDRVNHTFITFKWTNHICCCELASSRLPICAWGTLAH